MALAQLTTPTSTMPRDTKRTQIQLAIDHWRLATAFDKTNPNRTDNLPLETGHHIFQNEPNPPAIDSGSAFVQNEPKLATRYKTNPIHLVLATGHTIFYQTNPAKA